MSCRLIWLKPSRFIVLGTVFYFYYYFLFILNVLLAHTVIWLSPASLMVRVGDMKYLKARSRLSLSKQSAESSGSFTVLHIRSAMFLAALCRSSWSESLHRYLEHQRGRQSAEYIGSTPDSVRLSSQILQWVIFCFISFIICTRHR